MPTRNRAERALQISVAGTAALSSALLGSVENNFTLSLTAGIGSMAALLVTDLYRIFSLNQLTSTLLAVLALGTTLFRVELGASEDRLVSISDLLIYLQLILQFQPKNSRLYWQILTLSLLEIVVAAALNLGFSFGLFLILYLSLAVVSLVLLNIRILADGEFSRIKRADETILGGISDLHPIVGHDTMSLMVNRSLTWQIMRLIGLTLMLAVIVFFSMPRIARQGGNNSLFTSARQSGFSHSVSLSQTSEIADNDELVMRVQFSKWNAPEPYILNGEPYFHGTNLMRYEPLRGRWHPGNRRRRDYWQELTVNAPPSADVRERIVLEPGVTDTFSVFPAYAIASEQYPLRQAVGRDALVRSGDSYPNPSDGVRYDVRTSCFRHGMPRSIRPVVDPYLSVNPELLSGVVQECTEFPEANLRSVMKLAASVLESRNIDPERRVEAALCLESFLRRSETYRYSTKRKLPPPFGVDPIEHFLTTERWGHCEFFASALAMMLRSQGIPARLVVGYRGGEYNSFGQYYSVTQSHAHAWVEAYLRPTDLSEHSLREGESPDLGGWLRLDPTPAVQDQQTIIATSGWLWSARAIQDYMQHLWKDYVLGLNSQRQRQLIYRPLVERTSEGFRGTVLSRQWWYAFGQTLTEHLGLRSWEDFRNQWFHWKSVPLLMGMFLLLLATRQFWNRLRPALQPVFGRWLPSGLQFRRKRNRLERILTKWEQSLARRSWRRPATQTLHEFGSLVSQNFAADPRLAPHADLILTWIRQYYAARYAVQTEPETHWEILDRLQKQTDSVLRSSSP